MKLRWFQCQLTWPFSRACKLCSLELPEPPGMCALSEHRHKQQLDFARQVNPDVRLLQAIVPCDQMSLYEPNASVPKDTSLLFDTAEWDVLLDTKRELFRASSNPASTISSIKATMQQKLRELNAARANGSRYPATGPELRNVTIVDEGRDRIFMSSINRFQRPSDRGPVDQYAAFGYLVAASYIFKFSIFSYEKTESDLMAIAESEIDQLSRAPLN
jgi:hypothetical protein